MLDGEKGPKMLSESAGQEQGEFANFRTNIRGFPHRATRNQSSRTTN